jgi:hypothetical protein
LNRHTRGIAVTTEPIASRDPVRYKNTLLCIIVLIFWYTNSREPCLCTRYDTQMILKDYLTQEETTTPGHEPGTHWITVVQSIRSV